MKAKLLCFVAVVALLSSCGNDRATVVGRFTGHSDGLVYLEQVTPEGAGMIDSVKLDGRGAFRFAVRLPGGQPTFHNLYHDNGTIPLMLVAGERVVVSSMCDVSLNYTVEGSDESARMRDLKMLLSQGALRLDSLRQVVLAAADGDARHYAYVNYVNEMNRIKREHISFVVSQPARLSSLWGLYQRLAGERHLFSDRNDIVYYRTVADSVAAAYPASPYVAALRNEVSLMDRALSMSQMLAEKWQAGGDNYPDLVLPDIYGTEHTLSALNGKVILLDFWNPSDPASGLHNGDLKVLYDDVHTRGFEVFQVSLGTSRPLWVAAVQDQRLPWTNVGDIGGAGSSTARKYNISRLPSNFLIDRDGRIVARDLYGEQLVGAVGKLL